MDVEARGQSKSCNRGIPFGYTTRACNYDDVITRITRRRSLYTHTHTDISQPICPRIDPAFSTIFPFSSLFQSSGLGSFRYPCVVFCNSRTDILVPWCITGSREQATKSTTQIQAIEKGHPTILRQAPPQPIQHKIHELINPQAWFTRRFCIAPNPTRYHSTRPRLNITRFYASPFLHDVGPAPPFSVCTHEYIGSR